MADFANEIIKNLPWENREQLFSCSFFLWRKKNNTIFLSGFCPSLQVSVRLARRWWWTPARPWRSSGTRGPSNSSRSQRFRMIFIQIKNDLFRYFWGEGGGQNQLKKSPWLKKLKVVKWKGPYFLNYHCLIFKKELFMGVACGVGGLISEVEGRNI